MSILLLVLCLIHCSNPDNKDISSFTYVTDHELGIVVIANVRFWIILEDVTTPRVVQLEKQDTY